MCSTLARPPRGQGRLLCQQGLIYSTGCYFNYIASCLKREFWTKKYTASVGYVTSAHISASMTTVNDIVCHYRRFNAFFFDCFAFDAFFSTCSPSAAASPSNLLSLRRAWTAVINFARLLYCRQQQGP